jgi:LuxR family maltose regulon positive regulatory protein
MLGRVAVPKLPPGVLDRPRLFQWLTDAVCSPVTVVTGPAGWGKTQLLASWVGSEYCDVRCCWLTIERADADPQRFWPAVLAAVSPVLPRADIPVSPTQPEGP